MIYAFEEWELDVGRYELRSDGKSVKLEPQVFSVLAYLVEHRDRVISKQELLTHLWPDQFIGDSALERCIMAARKAIGDSGGQQRFIKTFHRRGYRFVAAVVECTVPSANSASSYTPLSGPSDWHRLRVPSAISAPPTSILLPSRPLVEGMSPTAAMTSMMATEPTSMTVLVFGLSNPQELYEAASPDVVQNILNSLFESAARHVQVCDGMMVLCTGNRFLALFGTSTSGQDHPWRAVQAAFDLRSRCHDNGFDLDLPVERLSASIALHTGDVVGRRFGDDPHVTYMAMGDTMQFAVNLQLCVEPGSVVASESTYRLVQDRVYGQIVGLVAAQPEAFPVAAYSLHRRRAQNVNETSYGSDFKVSSTERFAV
jgi:DNA-binding winged helix-turn-helix (wHTH) protein/class 3 adenylate cyclase